MLEQGRLVSIGNRSLFARVNGSGPAVVLNSGGGAAGIAHWAPIEQQILQFATVVTYDRAGLGRSDRPPASPTALDMVSDLHALLNALQITRPVALVGWSLSTLLVQLYACEHPTEVAGLVLLDPTPTHSFAGFINHPPALQERIRSAMLAKAGELGGGERFLLEIARMPESCELVRSALEDQRRLPDVPVIVLTACRRDGKAAGAGQFIETAHQRIAESTPRGRHIFAQQSSHGTMTADEPELIVTAIRSIVVGDQSST